MTSPIDIDVPRPEYPRPSFVRDDWMNLNGTWGFAFDPGDSGFERGLVDAELDGSIVVPFSPESELSGIGDVDFHDAVWYRREVTLPEGFADRRILLHLQACDHDTTVWADAVEVARHRGGWTPITADLGVREATAGPIVLVVRARDSRHMVRAGGKQSREYANHDCDYTRTTGIWQTVWLEPVSPVAHLERVRVTPDVAGGAFDLVVPVRGERAGTSIRATVLPTGPIDGEPIDQRLIDQRLIDQGPIDQVPIDQVPIDQVTVRSDLDLSARMRLSAGDAPRLWSPADPYLYDLLIELLGSDGTVLDTVRSYAGLRSVGIDGKAVLLNGEPVFQRLVLDQGYYPDGILTARDDATLVRDIELSMAAGFNGARLHQKVFEERFLHHADRLGYLVWGEFGDWGSNVAPHGEDNQQPTTSYVTQWLEAVERDYSHPCIVGWCPLNETHQDLGDRISQLDDVTRGMFLATKAFDTTRPVLDASGYSHRVRETDVWDSHNYEQDPTAFAAAMAPLAEGRPYANPGSGREWSLPYSGQPYFCSEFGGIWWNPNAGDEYSWGYGQRPGSLEEFLARFEGLVAALLDDPLMFGYCYTQLTDVFQEQNGIYAFDRAEKFPLDRVRAAQTRRAAIEQRG